MNENPFLAGLSGEARRKVEELLAAGEDVESVRTFFPSKKKVVMIRRRNRLVAVRLLDEVTTP